MSAFDHSKPANSLAIAQLLCGMPMPRDQSVSSTCFCTDLTLNRTSIRRRLHHVRLNSVDILRQHE
jgi:hypothetical protein